MRWDIRSWKADRDGTQDDAVADCGIAVAILQP